MRRAFIAVLTTLAVLTTPAVAKATTSNTINYRVGLPGFYTYWKSFSSHQTDGVDYYLGRTNLTQKQGGVSGKADLSMAFLDYTSKGTITRCYFKDVNVVGSQHSCSRKRGPVDTIQFGVNAYGDGKGWTLKKVNPNT